MMNTQINNEGRVRDLSHISQFRTARYSVMKAKALSRNASMQQPNHADCNKRVEAWQSRNVGNRFKAKAVCQQTISKTVSRKTVCRQNSLQAQQSPDKNRSVSVLLRLTKPGLVPIRQHHKSQLRERCAYVGASAASGSHR